MRAQGWALDPDPASPSRVVVSVNGRQVADVVANETRPDIGELCRSHGSAHGFDVTVPVPANA